uniref:Uncharacterized protein n=1 Tax=Oryza meridionalis TaxID=40149 RepID=A0A0E0C3W8_9ORYZ
MLHLPTLVASVEGHCCRACKTSSSDSASTVNHNAAQPETTSHIETQLQQTYGGGRRTMRQNAGNQLRTPPLPHQRAPWQRLEAAYPKKGGAPKKRGAGAAPPESTGRRTTEEEENQIWRERREGDAGAVLAASKPQQVGSPRAGPRQPAPEQLSVPTSPRRRSPSSPPPGLDVAGRDRGPPPAAASPAPRRLAAAGGNGEHGQDIAMVQKLRLLTTKCLTPVAGKD